MHTSEILGTFSGDQMICKILYLIIYKMLLKGYYHYYSFYFHGDIWCRGNVYAFKVIIE